jgi:hypothetical protein
VSLQAFQQLRLWGIGWARWNDVARVRGSVWELSIAVGFYWASKGQRPLYYIHPTARTINLCKGGVITNVNQV